MLLRARHVYPVCSPPIEDGAVIIRDDTILEVGRFRDLSSQDPEQTDLGEVVLMPGLINAHCHLDYTRMAGMIPPPVDFVGWIEAIIALKADWDYSDYASSWLAGAGQLLNSGVTTVADMEAVPELIPEVWNATPLRVHSFIELINVRGRQTPEAQVEEALHRLREYPNPRGGVGLSPHSLYSTNARLRALARDSGLPLAIHVAESAEEDQMFRQGAGRMHRWLSRNGRDMSDCDGRSPVRQLAEQGLLRPGTLAVHCNYLDADDIRTLAESGVSVVHCPNSHAYFDHAPFPAEALIQAGVNIALGTDSLASTLKQGGRKPALNLFDELRLFARAHPAIDPAYLIHTVTTHAARALGVGDTRGQLKSGAAADLIAFEAIDAEPETLIHADPARLQSMIAGQWQVWDAPGD